MKKIVCCLWLVLAMPSMALGLERRDGGYYCTEKFAGGLAYDDALKEWHGTVFKPDSNFVMKLSFRETAKVFGVDFDTYDVFITDEGTSRTNYCVDDTEPPSIDETGAFSCSTLNGLYVYKFNFGNHRFIRIYTSGYTNGADNNNDTPAIAGGLCTKIQ
jgi:hypothetical protein